MMDEKNLLEECRAMCIRMRKNSLKMSLAAGRTGAHLGGGLSMIEIMAVLYYAVMKINPKDTCLGMNLQFPIMAEKPHTKFLLLYNIRMLPTKAADNTLKSAHTVKYFYLRFSSSFFNS